MSLNIPLTEGWKIRSDKNNIMLISENNAREFVEGYYCTLENCLNAFLEKKIRSFDSTSIFGLLQAIKSFQTALNKAIQPLNLRVVASNHSSELKKDSGGFENE
jgi:hypothetical protein